MKSENYVVIQGWMCNELGLKGNELLVYALINGFSQDGESLFMGSRSYIAETFNISLPTVDKALKGLKDKQLIRCYTDGETYWHYAVTSKETLQGGVKKLDTPCKETLHNKDSNTNNVKEKSNSKELLQNFEFGNTKPKKENLYTKCVKMIDDWTDLPELRELLITFLKMRLEVKDKPLYANQWKGMLRKLEVVQEECHPHDFDEIIQQSIDRGYLSFYPISDYKKSNDIEKLDVKHVESMTDEDYRKERRINEERERQGLRTKF